MPQTSYLRFSKVVIDVSRVLCHVPQLFLSYLEEVLLWSGGRSDDTHASALLVGNTQLHHVGAAAHRPAEEAVSEKIGGHRASG